MTSAPADTGTDKFKPVEWCVQRVFRNDKIDLSNATVINAWFIDCALRADPPPKIEYNNVYTGCTFDGDWHGK